MTGSPRCTSSKLEQMLAEIWTRGRGEIRTHLVLRSLDTRRRDDLPLLNQTFCLALHYTDIYSRQMTLM